MVSGSKSQSQIKNESQSHQPEPISAILLFRHVCDLLY